MIMLATSIAKTILEAANKGLFTDVVQQNLQRPTVAIYNTSVYVCVYIYIYIHTYIYLSIAVVANKVILAIFYPFSQFCEISISLLSLQT